MAAEPTTTRDAELVDAARAGSVQAFECLVERYFGMACMIAYSYVGQRETAEDLAQETFLRAWLFLQNLQQADRFAPWITRIARNLASEWLRKESRAKRLMNMIALDDLSTDQIPDPQEEERSRQMEKEAQLQTVLEAIMQLPLEQREIVPLHYAEGLKQNEIAARLGMYPVKVGRCLKRALAALQTAVEPVLKESISSLRPSQRAVTRTGLAIAATAALSGQARSALAAVVAESASCVPVVSCSSGKLSILTGIQSLSKIIGALSIKGGISMAASSKITIGLTAAGIMMGGSYYAMKSNAQDNANEKAKSATVAQSKIIERTKTMQPTINNGKQLAQGVGIPGSAFDNVDLSESAFNNVNMKNTTFEDINMSNVTLRNINLSELKVDFVQWGGASFTHIIPPTPNGKQEPVRFEDVWLCNSTFKKVDLSGAKITESNLEGMTIDGILVTDLIAAYKKQAKLDGKADK